MPPRQKSFGAHLTVSSQSFQRFQFGLEQITFRSRSFHHPTADSQHPPFSHAARHFEASDIASAQSAQLRQCYTCCYTGRLQDRLQSFFNTAAFLHWLLDKVTRSRYSAPCDLHCLRDLSLKLAMLAFRSQHGLVPSHLASQLHLAADTECRMRLISASTSSLAV
jgi:hypothetical protein